ncbi:MAG: cytochrome c [Candidatus Rokuibacteriota bacterium]
MRQPAVRRGVVLCGLIAVALAGCAGGEKKTTMVGSGDIVADRQRLMKLNGASWADAQAKGKAGNFEAIAVNAETMAINAQHIPSMFPQGSLTEKSKAKPEIWQKWPEFEAASRAMVVESEKLRDAARSKDQAAVQAAMQNFGRNACGACHTPFRVPPPQQR